MNHNGRKSNNPHPHTPPHKTFGRYLKTMRQRFQESLGEVSGAVEIAVEQLDLFERGAELPNEDILMLLISHFGLGDDEAVKMWELAGYDLSIRQRMQDGEQIETSTSEEHGFRAPNPVMMIALDNRVLYTNGADIVTDESGVVINFVQTDSTNQQRYAVSRMGMSYVQAEQLLQTLSRALMHKKYLSGPKQLPPTSSK
jgi:hypothetical protein